MPSVDEDLHRVLLEMIARGRSRKMDGGRALARRGSKFGAMLGDRTLPLPSHVLKAEQSNTSIVYQDTFFLKLYRRVEEGINPDVELSRYLTEETSFANLPAYVGSIEWQRERSAPRHPRPAAAVCSQPGRRLVVRARQHRQLSESRPDAEGQARDAAGTARFRGSRSSRSPFRRSVRDFIGPVYLEMIEPAGPADRGASSGPDVPFPESRCHAGAVFPALPEVPLSIDSRTDAEGLRRAGEQP